MSSRNYEKVENPRLRELFKYLQRGEADDLHSLWYVIKLLQEKVERMNGDEEMEREYRMNEAEREEYLYEGIEIGEKRGREEGIQIGEARGIEIGEERGIEMTNANVILRMAEQKFPIEMIANIVDLTTDAVQRIIEEQQIA